MIDTVEKSVAGAPAGCPLWSPQPVFLQGNVRWRASRRAVLAVLDESPTGRPCETVHAKLEWTKC